MYNISVKAFSTEFHLDYLSVHLTRWWFRCSAERHLPSTNSTALHQPSGSSWQRQLQIVTASIHIQTKNTEFSWSASDSIASSNASEAVAS